MSIKADYIDHMGDDLRVVNAARVSFDKESAWEIETTLSEDGYDREKRLSCKDQRLISYLATHGHWTPFSHAMVTMRETVPIFVARQRFKHMVGFTYNEVSRRYVDSDPEFYEPDEWRMRADNLKQGSSEEPFVNAHGTNTPYNVDYGRQTPNSVVGSCLRLYRSMIEQGICPEQARMVLPQSMITSYYVTGSLAAWARAYNQRKEGSHAQKEIRGLAAQWNDIIKPLFPVSWAALATP